MFSFIDIPVVSFYLSMIGIVGMISFKSVEIRSGNKSWISRISESKNHIVRDVYIRIKKIIFQINKKNAIALLQWIAFHVLSWARDAYIWAHRKAHAYPHSKRVIDMVRGKGEIKKKGGVSFYLRRISEEDEEGVVK
jgi:hypothetical protein